MILQLIIQYQLLIILHYIHAKLDISKNKNLKSGQKIQYFKLINMFVKTKNIQNNIYTNLKCISILLKIYYMYVQTNGDGLISLKKTNKYLKQTFVLD